MLELQPEPARNSGMGKERLVTHLVPWELPSISRMDTGFLAAHSWDPDTFRSGSASMSLAGRSLIPRDVASTMGMPKAATIVPEKVHCPHNKKRWNVEKVQRSFDMV